VEEMLVLNVHKWGKPFMIGLAVIMIALLVLSGLKYRSENNLTKVDRSNAMQVSKAVTIETLSPTVTSDFFTEYRLERDRLRSEQSDLLRDVIRTAKNDDVRQKAQDAVLKLVVEKQREVEIENLIKARGFSDVLIVLQENAVNAVVKTQTLNRDEVLQVADIISRVAGVKPEDITISEKQ